MARWFIQEPNTAPMAPQSCSRGSCGKGLPSSLLDDLLVLADHAAPVVGRELGVERDAAVLLLELSSASSKWWCSTPSTTSEYIWMKRR